MLRRGIVAVLGCLILAARAMAQCEAGWLPVQTGIGGFPNVMTTWDPDGVGPMTPQLVIAGAFRNATGLPSVNNIVLMDPVTQQLSRLGTGVNGAVNALAVLPDGALAVGGSFTMAGGVVARGIARWDGNTWSEIGGGVSGTCGSCEVVYAMERLPNGDLVVGGTFDAVGGIDSRFVARWNGVEWAPMGEGLDSPTALGVYTMCIGPTGQLIAGGALWVDVGVIQRNAIVAWNGDQWEAMSESVLYTFSDLLPTTTGDVVVAGNFSSSSAARLGVLRSSALQGCGSRFCIAPVGGSVDGSGVYALAEVASGRIVAGGIFSAIGGTSARNVAVWDGSMWRGLGSGVNGYVTSLCVLPNGDIAVGGNIGLAGSEHVSGVAIYSFADVACDTCPSCPADYDQDGGVTGADIGAFFVDYEQGGACADVDQDGGVTGADVGAFFVVYEAGGC